MNGEESRGKMINQKIKVAELFAGVGGFHLGLSRASDDFKIVWANQYEPGSTNQFAFNIYYHNFEKVIDKPKANIVNKDISKVVKEDLDDVPNFNLLVGGFPCQDYSVLSSGAKGLYGKKGVLWWDIKDVIEAKWPEFIFLENVDRLLTSPGVTKTQPGRDFGMILRTLSDLGYWTSWKVINAADYGFPQRRRRTFIFAARRDTKYAKKLRASFLGQSEEVRKSALATLAPLSDTLAVKELTGFQTVNLMKYSSLDEFSAHFALKGGFKKTGVMIGGEAYMANYEPQKRPEKTLASIIKANEPRQELYVPKDSPKYLKFAELKGSFQTVKTSKTGYNYKYGMGAIQFPDPLSRPARTMVTSEHTVSRTTHVIVDPGNNIPRLLSPEEAELINTFQVGWTELPGVSNSQRYFAMGNSLVVDLVKEISESIDSIAKQEDGLGKAYSHEDYTRIHH